MLIVVYIQILLEHRNSKVMGLILREHTYTDLMYSFTVNV